MTRALICIAALCACSLYAGTPNGLSNANVGRVGLVAATASATGTVTGTYIGYTTTAAATSSGANTFSGVSIGTAASDRLVVVALHRRGGGAVSNVTIGGVSATLVAQAASTESIVFYVALYQAVVTTGATADISYTLDSAGDWAAIGVWTLTGASTTPLDTGVGQNATSFTDTLTAAVNGVMIGANTSGNDAPICTWGWALAGGENYDNDPRSASADTASGAFGVTDATSEQGSVTGIGANNYTATVLATWGPSS